MLLLSSLLLVLSTALSVFAQSLKDDLLAGNISASYPEDSSYDSARKPFNLRFDPHPAAITYPTDTKQVSAIVKVGAKRKLRVVARSGGHNYIANGLGADEPGALVIDLSSFNKIAIDDSSDRATIEPGNRLGTVAIALNAKSRAIPHGTCPYVGVGGHIAGGGFGFTSRLWGLNLDALISAEIVLANGTITTASSTSHSELFWAIRGAASSFGILTSLTYKTYPTPSSGLLYTYTWMVPSSTAASAILHWQDLLASSSLPSSFIGQIEIFKGTSRGSVSLNFIGGFYGGTRSELESILAPFLSGVPTPETSKIQEGSYIDAVRTHAGGSLDTSAPDATDTFYAKSLVVRKENALVEEAVTAFTDYLGQEGFDTPLNWFIQLEQYGGVNSAINAVPEDATAFAWRDALWVIQLYANQAQPPFLEDGFPLVNGMVESIVENSPEGYSYGAYVNYIEDKLPNWREEYYGSHYDRLQALKAEVDPGNVFRFKTSIELP